jgi:probable F420-dependent oxidoreductase
MEFGFGIPTRGALANPDDIAVLAQKGEEMGFDIVNVSDHIVIPRDIASRYPYSESGAFSNRSAGECLEQLSLINYLAGVTSRVRLLTSVMVLPHRNPVLTAKILATADVLSKGRVILGCGVGWMREEFDAIGTESFDERGAVGDEYIQVFKELWTKDAPEFEGKYASFSNITFSPKPVQKPHPPIWVGGESAPALRRAARLGNAWYPIGANPQFPVDTPERFSQFVSRLHRYAREAGRDPADLDLAFNASWYNDREAQTTGDGSRRYFTGTPEQVAGDFKAMEERGVRHIMVNMQRDTVDESLAAMDRMMDRMKPLVG